MVLEAAAARGLAAPAAVVRGCSGGGTRLQRRRHEAAAAVARECSGGGTKLQRRRHEAAASGGGTRLQRRWHEAAATVARGCDGGASPSESCCQAAKLPTRAAAMGRHTQNAATKRDHRGG